MEKIMKSISDAYDCFYGIHVAGNDVARMNNGLVLLATAFNELKKLDTDKKHDDAEELK